MGLRAQSAGQGGHLVVLLQIVPNTLLARLVLCGGNGTLVADYHAEAQWQLGDAYPDQVRISAQLHPQVDRIP